MATKSRKGVTDAAESMNQRLNLRASADAYRRLGVHAVMTGMAPGKLVEKLIEEHLRDFRVQVISGDRSVKSDRLDLSGNISAANSLAGL